MGLAKNAEPLCVPARIVFGHFTTPMRVFPSPSSARETPRILLVPPPAVRLKMHRPGSLMPATPRVLLTRIKNEKYSEPLVTPLAKLGRGPLSSQLAVPPKTVILLPREASRLG